MSWPCEIYTRKACFSLLLSLLYCHGSALTSIHDYCRNHSFDHRDLCCKVMSLLFSTLSTFVITFLPRNKHLLILWLQSLSAVILEPRKHLSLFPVSICHEVMGPDAMILVFWMLSLKPAFSLSSFTFIKRLFSSSSPSAIRVVPSAYQAINISPGSLDFSLCFFQPRVYHKMTLLRDAFLIQKT